MNKHERTVRKKSPVIGIDLGTTNSLVTYIKEGDPRIIPNERGDRMTPSVVFIKENGDVRVGQTAKAQAILNAGRTVVNVKRYMGKNKVFTIDGRQYSPVEISGLILKHLKSYAERYLEKKVESAVITVPAYFDDRQRQDTLKAAEFAGLTVLKLLNEPTAAALTYGFSEKLGSSLLVLDLGGGTLDITLMEYSDKVFRVCGVGGSTTIGGADFDRVIINYILQSFQMTYGIDLTRDSIAFQQIVTHSERAKIDLSSEEETQILIPYITYTDNGPIHLRESLLRTDFEKMAEPILSQIESRLDQTFQIAQLEPSWVDTVILVGGSTRVPAVEALVKNVISASKSDPVINRNNYGMTQRKGGEERKILRRVINPDEAVARGSALLAGILEGSVHGIDFCDVTPHDLGVQDDNSGFVTIVPRGTAYPTEVSRLFTTTQDNQEEVFIHVMQQVWLKHRQMISLGWFPLAIDRKKKKGEPNIEIKFKIDSNGILNVSAMDLESGSQKEITIHDERVIDMIKGSLPDLLKVHIAPMVGKPLKTIHTDNSDNTI